MKFYDAVYKLADEQNIAITKLSIKIGRGSRYIGGAKDRGSLPKVDNAAMILDGLGYVLCAVPDEDVTEDMITIE